MESPNSFCRMKRRNSAGGPVSEAELRSAFGGSAALAPWLRLPATRWIANAREHGLPIGDRQSPIANRSEPPPVGGGTTRGEAHPARRGANHARGCQFRTFAMSIVEAVMRELPTELHPSGGNTKLFAELANCLREAGDQAGNACSHWKPWRAVRRTGRDGFHLSVRPGAGTVFHRLQRHERRRDTGFYDLLASEARLCSYVAIALGRSRRITGFRWAVCSSLRAPADAHFVERFDVRVPDAAAGHAQL